MEYRKFGKTDLEVSAIGFGCWEIGGTYGRIDESQFRRAVRQAIDDGITCFDTAEAYGMGVSENGARPPSRPRPAALPVSAVGLHVSSDVDERRLLDILSVIAVSPHSIGHDQSNVNARRSAPG